MNTLIVTTKEITLCFTPMVLSAVLPSLSLNTPPLVKNIATETNTNLLKLISEVPSSILNNENIQELPIARMLPQGAEEIIHFDLKATLTALVSLFSSDVEETKLASLEWLILIHDRAKVFLVSFSRISFVAYLGSP
jgi:hypothetical protein